MIRWIKRVAALAVFSIGVVFAPTAWAQIPVTDVASLTQEMQQVAHALSQLQALNNQLNTMKSQLNASRGGRGMELLLNNQVRDYLPNDWGQVNNLANASNAQYRDIANMAKTLSDKNSKLSAQDLARYTPQIKQLILRARESAAQQQALGQVAYKRASQNVSQLQILTNKIGQAGDQKAIQDLQARIATEQAMLQNDAIKLAQAEQIMKAEERAMLAQRMEQSVAMSGTTLSASTVKVRCPRSTQQVGCASQSGGGTNSASYKVRCPQASCRNEYQ